MTDGNTVFGATPELSLNALDEWGADVIGLNCGVGPAIVLNAHEKMRAVTKKKFSAQPNAGLPRDVQGRQFYMCSPEYMAKFATLHSGRREVYRRLLWHHSGPYQVDLGCRSSGFTAHARNCLYTWRPGTRRGNDTARYHSCSC